MIRVRAAYIDRDGVINQLVSDPPESPLHARDVTLMAGAAKALKRLADARWLLVGISNQPAAAKGTVPLEELAAVQARVIELLAGEGVAFDDFLICCHHPDGVVPGLGRVCDCRKPAPGMLLDAADRLHIDLENSWMIGDTNADVLAGKAAGCRTVLVNNPRSAHKRHAAAKPDAFAADLLAATDIVLNANPVD